MHPSINIYEYLENICRSGCNYDMVFEDNTVSLVSPEDARYILLLQKRLKPQTAAELDRSIRKSSNLFKEAVEYAKKKVLLIHAS